jgi:hypothetical protein
VTTHRNQIVRTIAYIKVVASALFVLGDYSAGVLLISLAVLRFAFYYNPIFDKKKDS